MRVCVRNDSKPLHYVIRFSCFCCCHFDSQSASASLSHSHSTSRRIVFAESYLYVLCIHIHSPPKVDWNESSPFLSFAHTHAHIHSVSRFTHKSDSTSLFVSHHSANAVRNFIILFFFAVVAVAVISVCALKIYFYLCFTHYSSRASPAPIARRTHTQTSLLFVLFSVSLALNLHLDVIYRRQYIC